MASAAGTITVAIVGDTGRFDKSMTDTQRRVSMFGAAATVALAAFGVSAVKAFSETEQAQQKLNFALQQSPSLIGTTAASMAEYNKTLAEKIAIDDDVIAGAESVLARFADSEEELKSLTVLSADYARVTGTDMVSAAEAVGKATLGSTRPLKALGIAYDLTGNKAKDAANIQELLNEKVNGFAEEYAQTAAGQAEELARQFGELQETIGAALLPMLETLMAVIKPIATWFTNLPKPVQQATYFIALFGAAALAVGPRLLAMRASIIATQASQATLAATTGATTAAITAEGTAATATNSKMSAMTGVMGKLSLVTAGVTAALYEMDQGNKSFGDRSFIGKLLSGSLPSLATSAANAWQDFANIHPPSWVPFFGEAEVSAEDMASAVNTAETSVHGLMDSAAAAIPFLDTTSGAMGTAATASENLAEKFQTLTDKFTILKQGFLDSRSATRGFEAALDDANTALDTNGRGLNQNTAAGRANAEALDNVATAGDAMVTSLVKQGKSSEVVTGKYREVRSSLIDTAQSFGMSEAAAKRYADQALATPKQVRTRAEFLDDQAALEAWKRALATVDTIITTVVRVVQGNAGGGPAGFDGGGAVHGPGTETSDSVPAMLSRGEFVINARSAKKIGMANLHALNRMADGGEVGKKWGNNLNTFDLTSKFMDKLDEMVQTAKDQLKEIKAQRKDFAQGVTSGLMGGLSLGGTIKDGRDNDAKSILSRYKAAANRIKRFMRDMTKLQKKGLSKALTSELLEMGSEEGGTLARILLTDTKLLGQFNRVYSQLDNSATRFGNQTSQRWYGSKIDKARDDYKDAKKDRRQFEKVAHQTINHVVHVHGDVWTEKQLAKKLGPILQDEFKKIDRRNRR